MCSYWIFVASMITCLRDGSRLPWPQRAVEQTSPSTGGKKLKMMVDGQGACCRLPWEGRRRPRLLCNRSPWKNMLHLTCQLDRSHFHFIWDCENLPMFQYISFSIYSYIIWDFQNLPKSQYISFSTVRFSTSKPSPSVPFILRENEGESKKTVGDFERIEGLSFEYNIPWSWLKLNHSEVGQGCRDNCGIRNYLNVFSRLVVDVGAIPVACFAVGFFVILFQICWNVTLVFLHILAFLFKITQMR